MSYNIEHQGVLDRWFYTNPETIDFHSPATQGFLRDIGTPLWQPTFSSRCGHLPMWDRPDMFRRVTQIGTTRLNFTPPMVESPALSVSPSGMISLRNSRRALSLTITDRDLYHHDAQKVFSIMVQFDTLTEHQVSAFAGIPLDSARRALATLYAAEVVTTPNPAWEYQDDLGSVWRLNMNSHKIAAYLDGMEPLYRALAVGEWDPKADTPPGSGGRETVKHNLFAAEVMLRLAESGDLVAGVWGDMFASEHYFHTGGDNVKRRKSHGDCVVVTKDGSVVIIEITGSVTDMGRRFQTLANKAASWVGVIAHSLLDVSVLFVDTSWYKDKKYMFNAIDMGIRHDSAAYAPDNVLRRRAQRKVGIVNASWWFPEDGCISRAGTRLGAYSPIDREFRAFDTPDPFYSTAEHRRDVVLNNAAALHTPHWISDGMVDREW